MPQNLRTLKSRIRTAKNIAQLAKTLEMVSVAKIRRARGLAETVRPYAERITSLGDTALRSVAPGEFVHPYLGGRAGAAADTPEAARGRRRSTRRASATGMAGAACSRHRPRQGSLRPARVEPRAKDARRGQSGTRGSSPWASGWRGPRHGWPAHGSWRRSPSARGFPSTRWSIDLVLAINELHSFGQAPPGSMSCTRVSSPTSPRCPRWTTCSRLSRSLRRRSRRASGRIPSSRTCAGLLEALLPHYPRGAPVRCGDAGISPPSTGRGWWPCRTRRRTRWRSRIPSPFCTTRPARRGSRTRSSTWQTRGKEK